jgi:hypothetical protein
MGAVSWRVSCDYQARYLELLFEPSGTGEAA